MKLKDPVPVKDIAHWVQAEIIGPDTGLVSGLNEIHNVEPGDLSFVDHEKYYDFTLRSAATFILINIRQEAPEGKTLLYHPEPFRVYNQLAQRFHPELRPEESRGATYTVGEGTYIYPNVFIGEKVTIGKNCVIHPNVTIYPYTVIGDDVIIHANTTIGADAFYYKRQRAGYEKMHTAGKVVIQENVEIGAGCTIDAGVSAETHIGAGTKIDDQVHIGHDVTIGKDCIICGQVGIAGNTRIGNRVTLYGKVAVNKNIEIGDNVIVLATSAVAQSLEPGKTYLGIPAQESRAFARQFALIKKLPELWAKLNS